MAARRRRYTTRRRSNRRRRRNPPYFRSKGVTAYRARPLYRRNRRRRRNPVLPTKMLGQALWLGAGFLGAPMLTNLIPWQPASKLGQWAKTAIVVTLGSQLAKQVAGAKAGNALLAGGYLSIAVDLLRSGTTIFGAQGVGYYYPDDNALVASWEGAGLPPAAEIPGSALAGGRLAPRFH